MSESSQIEEMKRYIFHEMSEEEFDAVEDRYFDDSDYFNRLTSLENDLIDRYLCKLLSESDSSRFEKSIDKVPGRRDKILKARAMQNIIAEEKSKTLVAASPGFWEKLAGFFNLKTGLQYATAGLAVLLISALGYLLYQNHLLRQEQEMARQQDENNREALEQQIQEQLRINQENSERLRQLEIEKGESAKTIEERQKLEEENDALKQQLDKLKNQPNRNPQNKAPQITNPLRPILTTIVKVSAPLLPGGGRDGSEAKLIEIKPETKRINVNLEIPSTYEAKTFSAELQNGTPLVSKRKPSEKSGKRFINVTIPVGNLDSKSEQKIYLFGDDSQETETYIFRLKKVK